MSIRIIATFLIILSFSGLVIADDSNELNYKPGELIVRFAPKAKGIQRSKDERKAILTSIKGGKIKHSFKRVPGLTVVKLSEKDNVKDKIKAFKNRNDILYAEPNYKIRLLSTVPDDTHFDNLWGMHNTGQTSGTADADIDAPEAWDIATEANNIIVAVLDSGIDYDHEDLSDNMWINETELNGTTDVDDDNNGYVDDIYGWDFADNNSNPYDYSGHGTHVAGTIGAIGNNDQGVAGVCWNTKIMTLKIFPNYGQEGFITGAIGAIEYAVDMGANVLNNSWAGGPYSQSLKDAIDDAGNAGVLFIAAAGNPAGPEGSNNDIFHIFPSSYELDNIIAVMATDHDDEISIWPANYKSSAWGPESVDIAAPGTDIYSCAPNDQYAYMDGTSMAAPHVAGACALVWFKHPSLTHLQVKDAILNSVDKLASLDGLCVTEGRLNLFKALTETLPISIEITDGIDPNSCGVDPSDPNNNTITYTLVVTHDGIDPNFPSDPGDPNSPRDPNITGDIENVTLVDYLPSNINLMNVTVSSPGSYSQFDRTATWELGTLSPGDSNSVTVTVTMLEGDEPCGEIDNTAEVTSPDGSSSVTFSTPVCFYGGDVIYVDSRANGSNAGVTWQNAYTELTSAFERAAKGCSSEIWVAGGVYTPTDTGNAAVSFDLVDEVKIYGGFCGNETSISQRDFVQHKTYLSGDISATDNDPNSDYVVSASDGITDSTILDGFVICRGVKAGIRLYDQEVMDSIADPNIEDLPCDISPNIVNCYITRNEGDGIQGQLADPNIYACIIADNDANGIDLADVLYVSIDRSVIRDNTGPGISLHAAEAADITNCFIYNNSTGIISYNGDTGIDLRNNTIVYNENHGINLSDSESVTVTNSILWGNYDGASQTYGCTLEYCCYETSSPSGTGNFNSDPGFAYTEPNACNYHLAEDSNCIDAGDNTDVGVDETDIDGDDRIYNDYVDMGADEYTCSDVYNELDFNGDRLVDLKEFSYFSTAWFSHDPNDPVCDPNHPNYIGNPNDPDHITETQKENWNPICNLDTLNSPYSIDIYDLVVFAPDWLWESCWGYGEAWQPMEMAGMMESMAAGSIAMPLQTTTEPQPMDPQEILDFLDAFWKDDLKQSGSIDQKAWNDLIDAVEKNLFESQ